MDAIFLLKKKTLITIFFNLFLIQLIFAQDPPIKGIVVDNNNLPLEFASVALLRPIDSVMISFAITDSNGEFKITDSPSGEYLLQIYLTSYLPFYKNIDYINKEIDLKTITLNPNVEQLNEVTITAVIPVQIKKDTISYNANSFKIHHDDNIEDLLKKLPGVELDENGSIISQGNKSQKFMLTEKNSLVETL